SGKFKLKRGLFKGETTFSDKILAAGFGIEKKKWLTSQLPSDEIQTYSNVFKVITMMEYEKIPLGTSTIKQDMKIVDGIFPGTEWSGVFPSGLLGLSQKGSGLFQAAVNTAKLYSPECMGWEPLPIVLARLGLSGELSGILKRWPTSWQIYCNGFAQHGTRDMKKADAALRFRTNLAKDASLPEEERKKHEFPFPAWPFRHMCMDPMSILASAMNESLLQSHDGVIRVAPASEEGQNARFNLHAADGFIVSAEIENGKPVWISIRSLLGKTCRIKNPWVKLYLSRGGAESISYEQDTVEFSTQKGDVLMIVPEEATMKNWKTVPVEYQRNENPKTDSSGNARLGLPRMF
ncbi:MAG: hypothetical protein KAT86_00420, partial [Candidatus Latescibacteria bacterium]|nr:hypothetical protein [Candidatus Latescibacterota bacterium]